MSFFKVNIIGFQSPATPVMEGIIDFHNYVFFYLILIFIFVMWMYLHIIYNFYVIPTLYYNVKKNFDIFYEIFFSEGGFLDKYFFKYKFVQRYVYFVEYTIRIFFGTSKFQLRYLPFFFTRLAKERQYEILSTRHITEYFLLELIWTIIPEVILLLIAIPSLGLLYAMDEVFDPVVTLKATGYQWFWSYEYGKVLEGLWFNYITDSLGYNLMFSRGGLSFDSVMVPESDLKLGKHRLLEVDRQVVLPINTHIRLSISAADVLHSWAVPAFGIKIDAVPGRVSQVGLYIKREGVFYGQCSELCGVNHGFMPIAVKAVNYDAFVWWYWVPEVIWNDDILRVG